MVREELFFGQGKVSERSGILFQTKSGHPEFCSPPSAPPPPPPPPYMLSSPCITTKNCTILNMSDINQRRRKLFNIGRGAYPAVRGQHQYLGGGGGGGCKMYIHACMHTSVYKVSFSLEENMGNKVLPLKLYFLFILVAFLWGGRGVGVLCDYFPMWETHLFAILNFELHFGKVTNHTMS